jgi:transposase
VLGERTVSARQRSFDVLLTWARRHGADAERVWAIEDCRHVSGALERFLLARGEAVVRIAPKLTVNARKSARESGKSDLIDAAAIAPPRCAKASTRCRSRGWPARSSTSGCSSITANGWLRNAPR